MQKLHGVGDLSVLAAKCGDFGLCGELNGENVATFDADECRSFATCNGELARTCGVLDLDGLFAS